MGALTKAIKTAVKSQSKKPAATAAKKDTVDSMSKTQILQKYREKILELGGPEELKHVKDQFNVEQIRDYVKDYFAPGASGKYRKGGMAKKKYSSGGAATKKFSPCAGCTSPKTCAKQGCKKKKRK